MKCDSTACSAKPNVSKNLPFQKHPSPKMSILAYEHLDASTCVRHRKSCTCLFSMIQSAAGSNLHPLVNQQQCPTTVPGPVRQTAADRQTSRSGPPHNHHLSKHCTSCTQGIQNATRGIGPEPEAQLMHLGPPESTQHTTFSASTFMTCWLPLHFRLMFRHCCPSSPALSSGCV